MTHKEILEKAIRRAVDGGWQPLWSGDWTEPEILEWGAMVSFDTYYPFEQIIFSHSFAKALWGDELMPSPHLDQAMDDNWRIHLQNMVTEEDPIKYLGENLPAGND